MRGGACTRFAASCFASPRSRTRPGAGERSSTRASRAGRTRGGRGSGSRRTCTSSTPTVVRSSRSNERRDVGGGGGGDGMTEMREIATGLQFPEGPVALPDGSVLVVEIRRGTLTRVAPDGRTSIVARTGGGPNGAAIGPDGKVYVCNNGGFEWHDLAGLTVPGNQPHDYSGGRIQRVDLDTGKVEDVYTACDGRPLRGPNDLVFDTAAASGSPTTASCAGATEIAPASSTRAPTGRSSRRSSSRSTGRTASGSRPTGSGSTSRRRGRGGCGRGRSARRVRSS